MGAVIFYKSLFILARRPTELQLMQVLNKLKSKWKEIGIAFKITRDNRDSIDQKRYQSATCHLNDIITLWLDNCLKASWLTVIDAIKNDPVNNPVVAMEIKEFAMHKVRKGKVDDQSFDQQENSNSIVSGYVVFLLYVVFYNVHLFCFALYSVLFFIF